MVAQTTDVVSPVGVSVAHTPAPCQPAPLRFATSAAAATFRHTFRVTGPGLYEVESRTRPGHTHVYDAVDDRCGCEATRSCWHRDLYLALTSDLDQADALIAAAIIEPVIEIEVVDPVLLAAATSGADSSAGEPAPCIYENRLEMIPRCTRPANPFYAESYCAIHGLWVGARRKAAS